MARPLVFQCAAGACFGWFHAAAQPTRDTVVVMCPPLGYEAICSYRTYTQFAQMLAAAGFDVLRFDYHGTGDSAGSDADPDRAAAWLASTWAAMEEAQRVSGAKRVAVFGLRFGATIAMHASAGRGGVDSLVMWAPCASGRAFVREMRAAEMARTRSSDGQGIEALGMSFTPETLEALSGIDASSPLPPARDVLVVARDDLPMEGPLPSRLRALGCATEFKTWAGYAGMMVAEPHEAVVPLDTLSAMADWLGERHPAVARSDSRVDRISSPAQLACGPVIETPLTFGDGDALFGVLAEPQAGARGARADTAVLMLNVGGNYHIGPNRNYVKAAREFAAAGYRALRFDVRGVGDSASEGRPPGDSMYRDWATADVSAAVDMLAARGCRRFVLMGICSGSYLAFQTALKDPRVAGIMLMNSRLLEWDTEKDGPWHASMQRYYKSTRYYRQALLRPDVYARLLRGQVDVLGIARRMGELVAARLARQWEMHVLGRAPSEGVLRKFRHLSKRGVETLVAMSEQDDGLDYMQFHLGVNGRRMRGQKHFRMAFIPNADHTFSTVESQRALFAELRGFLDRMPESASISKVTEPVGLLKPMA